MLTLKDFFGEQNAFEFCNVFRQRENRSLEDVMAYLLDMDCNSKQITGFLDTWYAFKISKYISRTSDAIWGKRDIDHP